MAVNITHISHSDKTYPALLKEIPDAPSSIYVMGSLAPSDALAVAIVGTRKATVQGKQLARSIASKLAARGIVIVSGLAIGIDTAAHEGAIEAKGVSIAILANGLNTIYPAQNKQLADKLIALGGAVISEYAPNTPAFPNQFLARNRIVSGLCVATIVIEAPERSGTLATARFALEQGRDVFVVPGPVGHPNYTGSHKLIRDGARLTTSPEDILEDLGLASMEVPRRPLEELWTSRTGHERSIVATLAQAGAPLDIDKLSELTHIEAQTINSAITTLLMDGVVKETERGYSI